MTHDPNREAWFDTWLDAKLSGKPLPAVDPGSFDVGDMHSLQAVTDGAARFHTLATQSERRDHHRIEQDQIWKRVLEDQGKPIAARHRFRPGWSAVLSTLVAAVVLIALIAGFRKFDFGEEPGGNTAIEFGSSGKSDVDIGTFADAGCSTEPVSKENLLNALISPPDNAIPRSNTILPSEETDIFDEDIPPLIHMANQFYTCLFEGRPMSALSLTTTSFRQDWVMSQVAFTYGVFSDEAVTKYVDSLVEKEDQSRADGFNPIGTTFFSPEFQPTGWSQTDDWRVHLRAIWTAGGGQAELRNYLVNPPSEVVFMRSPTGDWLIDRIGSDIDGG
jgi:hypothetical protein